MTDKTIKRIDGARKLLNSVRPAQWVCYFGLATWSVYTVLCDPSTPISRGMPSYIRGAYVAVQLIAPLVAFAGQIVQCRWPHDKRMTENGWWLQVGADGAIWWTLAVAILAYQQANDEPSAMFTVGMLAMLMVAALLLVVRDGLEIVNCRCLRRRAREAGR